MRKLHFAAIFFCASIWLYGCNLEGGPTAKVTVEPQFGEFFRVLAKDPADSGLNRAVGETMGVVHNNDSGIVNMFAARYLAENPGKKLAPLFAKSDDVITADMADNAVIASLNKQAMEAMQYEAKALERRANEVTGRRCEAKVDTVRKLIVVQVRGEFHEPQLTTVLEACGEVGFYETYTNAEMLPLLSKVNDTLVALLPDSERAMNIKDSPEPKQIVKKGADDMNDLHSAIHEHDDSLNRELRKDEKQAREKMKRYPLFNILNPDVSVSGNLLPGPVVGFTAARDTAKLNRYLQMPGVKNLLPRNVRFVYGEQRRSKLGLNQPLEVYAIKVLMSGKAIITGDMITKASVQKNAVTGELGCVDIDLDKRGAEIWKEMTTKNIGSYIAIVYDGVVYSCPRVASAITGGKTEICGSYTKETAGNLANVLSGGKLPLPARVLNIIHIDPKQ